MNQLPPLNALKYFESAARCGSYVKAARELKVSPAAVSQQVRLLEQFFRRKLFVRYNNRIVLTDAGESIYSGSAPALQEIAALAARFRGTLNRSALVVSVLPSLAECWLLPHLSRLGFADLGLKLDLRVEPDPVDFAEQQIDLRVTYGNATYPDLQVVTLFQDVVVPLCSASFAKSHIAPGTRLCDLPEESFIHTSWGPEFASHPDWNDWFTMEGSQRSLQASKGHQVNASRLALDCARMGLGVALGQRSLAEGALRSGALVQISDKTLPLGHAYCAIFSRARLRKPGVQKLLDLLRTPFQA